MLRFLFEDWALLEAVEVVGAAFIFIAASNRPYSVLFVAVAPPVAEDEFPLFLSLIHI